MKLIYKVQMINGYRTEYFSSYDVFLSKFFSVFYQYDWTDKTIRFEKPESKLGLFSVEDCSFIISEEKLYV